MRSGSGFVRWLVLAGLVGYALAGAPDVIAASDDGARPVSCGNTRSWLVPFQTAAFPWDGTIPGKGVPFLDREEGGRRGHTSPRGGVYWEDTTYSDNRVLLSVPAGFDPSRPAVMVLYFHGNSATLERDVCRKQRVPQQVAASGLNAVLVAPQLARDALDSSAGRFWEPNALRSFLDEAAARLGGLTRQTGYRTMPVIVVAYSGGYLPAVYAIEIGGAGERIQGLVLMDALFGEVEHFADVVAARRSIFVASAFSGASKSQNAQFRRLLAERGVETGEGMPESFGPGTVTLIPSPGSVGHADFMTRAFASDPLRVILGRVAGTPAGARARRR